MNLYFNGILLLLAALLLPQSEAGLAHGVYKDPAHPGKCVITPNFILNPGQEASYPDMGCAGVRCGQNSEATISTCFPSVYAVPPNCRLVHKDPNADYPKCCEQEPVCN